jgi:hypothetical protein
MSASSGVHIPVRVASIVLSGIALPGILACTALVQRSAPPERVLVDEFPTWAVIGTTAGEEIVLRTPRLQGDSLVVGSRVEDVGDYPAPPDLVGIPLEDVAWVATRESDEIAHQKALANGLAFAGFLLFPFVVAVTVGFR